MDALTSAETAFVVRQLAAIAPHLIALAPVADRDELARLCREELMGADVRARGWDIRGRWFGVVVAARMRTGRQRRGGTVEWRVVAAYLARDAAHWW